MADQSKLHADLQDQIAINIRTMEQLAELRMDAHLLCEAWEYLEDMPEPTDMVQQFERGSLLVRLRAWGKS